MSAHSTLENRLREEPARWLVTGAAGFIGSHLLESLLKLGQTVVALDNFSTGRRENLEAVRESVGEDVWESRSERIEGDIEDAEVCARACGGIDYVLHQGGLGSVPRSLSAPLKSHGSNVTGTLNMMVAARDAGVKSFVYASSSSVYGDEPNLPKVENRVGAVLSPYAATKIMLEIYGGVFAKCYGLRTVGLRYFNVFGPRQDPEGAYAAVIPKWVSAMISGEPIMINGDGETSRDFCYIANVVQANLLAATSEDSRAVGTAFNVAVGGRTTLNELFAKIRSALLEIEPGLAISDPVYKDFRAGDVRHSLADISKAREILGYAPTHTLEEGMREAVRWYFEHLGGAA